MSLNTDRIGRYFDCFHEVTGQSTQIGIVSIDEAGEAETHWVNHTESDAQGALFKVCALRNEMPIKLPGQRGEKKPSLSRQFVFLSKYLKSMGDTKDPTLRRPASTLQAPKSVAYESLSSKDTQSFRDLCKRTGVSPTSLLTWTLHKAIGIQSGILHHDCNWSIPVSLRGPLKLKDNSANHAVPLFLRLDSSIGLAAAHAKVQDQLASGMHWGAYRMLTILGSLPKSVYRALIKNDERKMAAKGHWFAVLSNVGAINGDPRVAAKALIV